MLRLSRSSISPGGFPQYRPRLAIRLCLSEAASFASGMANRLLRQRREDRGAAVQDLAGERHAARHDDSVLLSIDVVAESPADLRPFVVVKSFAANQVARLERAAPAHHG